MANLHTLVEETQVLRQFRIGNTSGRFIVAEDNWVELYLPGCPIPLRTFLGGVVALGRLLNILAQEGCPQEYDDGTDGTYDHRRHVRIRHSSFGATNYELLHEWRRDRGDFSFNLAQKLVHLHVSCAGTVNGIVSGRLADLLALVGYITSECGIAPAFVKLEAEGEPKLARGVQEAHFGVQNPITEEVIKEDTESK